MVNVVRSNLAALGDTMTIEVGLYLSHHKKIVRRGDTSGVVPTFLVEKRRREVVGWVVFPYRTLASSDASLLMEGTECWYGPTVDGDWTARTR